MNRRDFISRFAQTAAGAALVHTLDVDKLLWVAGERTIFLPSIAPVCGMTIGGINSVTFAFWRNRASSVFDASLYDEKLHAGTIHLFRLRTRKPWHMARIHRDVEPAWKRQS